MDKDGLDNISKHMTKDGWLFVEVDLVLDVTDSCVWTLHDYLQNYEGIAPGNLVVRINMEMPESAFIPAIIKIEMPKELITPIVGEAVATEIPIEVRGEMKDITVEESLSEKVIKQKDSFLLTCLRRVVKHLEERKKE